MQKKLEGYTAQQLKFTHFKTHIHDRGHLYCNGGHVRMEGALHSLAGGLCASEDNV